MNGHVRLIACLLFAGACVPAIDRAELTADTVPPGAAEVSADRVVITLGNVMAINVVVFDEDGDIDDGIIEVVPTTTNVRARVSEGDPDVGAQYVLSGVREGMGRLFIASAGTTGNVVVPYEVIAPLPSE